MGSFIQIKINDIDFKFIKEWILHLSNVLKDKICFSANICPKPYYYPQLAFNSQNSNIKEENEVEGISNKFFEKFFDVTKNVINKYAGKIPKKKISDKKMFTKLHKLILKIQDCNPGENEYWKNFKKLKEKKEFEKNKA